MESLACLHVCSRALKTRQQQVRSIVVTAMKDTSFLCNPVLHAMVIVAKLDSSFLLGVPGYSRETPSAAWEACVSRLPGEDTPTLANRVFDSYLQKLGDDIDHHTIWSNEQYASEINTRTANCLGNDVSDPARGRANHHQFTLHWHAAQQRIRSGGCKVQEMSNTYIASHHIQTFELANDAVKVFNAQHPSSSTPKRVAAVQPPTTTTPTLSRRDDGDLHKMVAALSKQMSTLQTSTEKTLTPTVAVTTPHTPSAPVPQRGGGKGGRGTNTGRGGRGQPYNAVPRVVVGGGVSGLPPPNSRSDPRERTYSNGRKCAHPEGATGNPSNVNWTPELWEYGVFVDFDEWLRLGSYDELTTLLAQARPSDDTCSTHRVGRAKSDNGTWTNDNGCAYCLFRPRAPAGTAESDKWMYGTGQGAHSPYRCQCFIRFLAEGGGPDTPDKHRPYLQGILLKRFDKY